MALSVKLNEKLVEFLTSLVAFRKGVYETAFKHYADGIVMINRHGGYSIYTIEHELENLANKLDALPPETAYQWALYLSEQWQHTELDRRTSALLGWCDQQAVRMKFRQK